MRQSGLKGVQKRRFRCTTRPGAAEIAAHYDQMRDVRKSSESIYDLTFQCSVAFCLREGNC